MKARKEPTQRAGKLVYLLLALFGLPFAMFGLAADIALIKLGFENVRMRFWQEVPCTILAAELEERHDSKSTTYRVTAKYRYEFDGTEHIGTRITPGDSSDSSKAFHQRIYSGLDQFRQSGQTYPCYVNPGYPDEAILQREDRWGVAAIQTWAALMFSGVGFGLLGVVIASWIEERKQQVPASANRKPWEHRADWAAGEIQHSDRKAGQILIWTATVIVLISIPGLLSSVSELVRGEEPLAILGLVPTALGLLVMRVGLKCGARWRRFGDSTFKLASVPGVLGGSLAGVVQVDRLVDSPDGFLVRLCCTETSRASTDSESGSTKKILLEDERTILRDLPLADFAGTAIPVMFALPYDAPQSTDDPEHDQRKWSVTVRSLSPGVDYRAEFEVPVFRTPKSDRYYQPDHSVIADYQAPANSEAPLTRAGLFSETLPDNGTRFVFPRGRNPGFAICMTFLQLVFAAALVTVCYFKWSTAWPYLAGLSGISLLYSMTDLLFFRSELDVTSAGMVVRTGIFRLGSPKEFAATDIKQFVARFAGSAGSTAAVDLVAELASGKRVILAKRIIPRPIAEDIIRRIEEILGQSKP
jgi:hypothetical protein